MSLLSEFFVAPREQAALYDSPSAAQDDFQADAAAHYKGIGPVELSMLWSILQGFTWQTEMLNQFPCVLNRRDGERLIHEVPPAMIERLADLPDERVRPLAAAWAATEELACDTEEILPVLEDLQALAQTAIAEDKGLFLWNCI